MADYKGLNIKFQGDTTDAAKALHILSSEARAAEGNLQGIQGALKNTTTNGEELGAALKKFQLDQFGKQAEAARSRVNVLGQAMGELQKNLAGAQQKLADNKAALASMPEKYEALASKAKEFSSSVQGSMAEVVAAQEALAGTQAGTKEYDEAFQRLDAAVLQNVKNLSAEGEALSGLSAKYGTIEGAINSAEEAERSYTAAIEDTTQKQMVAKSAAQAYENQQRLAAAALDASTAPAVAVAKNAADAASGLRSMGDTLTSVGDKMTIVSGIAAMTFGRSIISSTEEFGNAIAQLGGYLDIGGAQLKDMQEDALKWGKDTQFSATEAANAMNELAKGGMTQAQIQGGAMKATMELAAAGSLDMAQAASVAVQAIKTFGLDAADASSVADALAGAANKSTAEVTELANGFKYVGGWASMAGWNINDVSGALALLSDHGLQSEMAGTALRNVMQRLAAPTNTAAKLMNAYGFSVRDANGQMVSATEVVQRLNDTFGSLPDEEKQNVLNDIFGARALPAAIALMDEGAEKLQTYIDATSQAGYATEMAKNRMGDLGWALEYLRGEAETAAVNFGQALAPTIIGLAKNIEGLLEWFNSLDDSTKQFIAQSAVMAVAVGPVISVIGHLSKGVAGMVGSVGTAMTTIAEFVALSADGGNKVKLFAEALALAKTPAAETAEGIKKVAENAATMEKALQTAGAALKGAIAVAAVAFIADQIKSVADEAQLVGEATKSVSDIAREASESVASMGDEAEKAGSKASTVSHALAGMNASLKESAEYNKGVSESLKEMEGNVSSAERYAATIKELSSVGSLSAAQQEQLKQAVDGYNEVTGAAIRITDEMRGTLNLMPQDIDKVTEAYVRQEKMKVYTELQSEALKEQIRAQKEAKKATEETQNAFWNWQNVVTTAANSFTGLGQIMNIVNYGKAAIGLKGVSDASAKASYDVNYFKEAAEAAGVSTEQYKAFLKQLFPELNNSGDAAQQAGDAIRQAAQEAAQAQREANQQIISAQQAAYDAEYKAAQKAMDAEYKAAQKAYDNEYKAAQKAFDNEYKIQQKAFDKEYKALQKQLDKEYKAQQKAFDEAYKQRQKKLDRQYDAYKKQLDSEEAALKKSLDAKATAYKKQLDSELATLKKANDQRLKQQKKADEEETKAFKAETDKRVKALQAEYNARLKTLELQYGGSDIDSQIKALKNQTKAEQDEIKRREQQEKKAELERKVAQAKTRRTKADAEKELNDYLQEIAQEQREKERDAQIEQLEEQKSALKDELAAKKEALKEEYDARIEALKEQRAAELEVTKEANDQEYEALKEQLDGIYNARKEANDDKIEQMKEANQVEIDNLKEHHSLLLENMKEQHTAQLEQLKEQQSEQLETIKEGQQAQLDNLKEYQQAQLDAMKEGQQAELEALKEAQQAELDALKEGQQAQLESLKESQQAQLEELRASLEAQVQEIVNSGNAMAGAAANAANQTAQSMSDGLSQMPWQVGATAGQTLQQYLDNINDMPWSTKELADTTGHNLQERLNAYVMPTTDASKSLRNAALREIEGLPDEGREKGEGMGSGLSGGMSGKEGDVRNSSDQLKNAAEDPLSGLPRVVSGFGLSSSSGFASGLGSGKEDATRTAQEISRSVSNNFSQPANDSGSWGSDMMRNFNNAIVDYWNNHLRDNVESIAQGIRNLIGHSKPKEGPLKDDDVWFYHMMQNLDSGMQRGIPELMGTVGDLAQGVADGMDVQPDIDFVSNLIADMRSEETALARQSRRMADIVQENFDPYARTNYQVGYDAKPMVQAFASGVNEALRSGVPQQAGVTIVIQNARFSNDMDVDRFSERVTARVAASQRRGW